MNSKKQALFAAIVAKCSLWDDFLLGSSATGQTYHEN